MNENISFRGIKIVNLEESEDLQINLCDFDHRSTAVGSRVCPKRNAADAKESIMPGFIFGSYLNEQERKKRIKTR